MFIIALMTALFISSELALAQEISVAQTDLNLNSSNTFTIKNTGQSRLNYVIESNTSFRSIHSGVLTESNALPVSPGPTGTEAIPNTALWLENAENGWDDFLNPNRSIYSIQWNSNFHVAFEELGWSSNVNNQEGWAAQGETWHVNRPGWDSPNSIENYFHYFFTGLSDNSNVPTGLFSPRVQLGSEKVSSFTIEINLANATGNTWQIVPQSITDGLVATRLQVNPDGTLQVLVKNSAGEASYQRINASLPTGSFKISMEVDRITSIFTILFDNQRVFTGKGFSSTIDQIAVLSLNEMAGPLLVVYGHILYSGENSFDLNGASSLLLIETTDPDISWAQSLSHKVEGSLEAGDSTVKELFFYESDLVPGVYQDSIKISSNDPSASLIFLPYTVSVERPYVAPPDYSSINDIDLTYDTLEATIYSGDVATIHLTLHNKSQVDRVVHFPSQTIDPIHRAFSNGSRNFHWIEISETGTAVPLGDDDSQTIQMSFPFPFAEPTEFVTIGSNGYLVIGATPANNPRIELFHPRFRHPHRTIAPYWCDLSLDDFSSVYYKAENDKFIVQYNNVPFKGTDIRNTFEAILYKDGSIEFQYLNINDQLSASIGISGSWTSTSIAYKEPLITDSLSILFQAQTTGVYNAEEDYGKYAIFPWIQYPVDAVLVEANSSLQLPVQLSSTLPWGPSATQSLPLGIHEGRVFLLSIGTSEDYYPNSNGSYDKAALVLPIKINILENPPPVINPIASVSIFEEESKEIILSATDSNDTQVMVYLDSIPEFITLLQTQDGSVQYSINPEQGDAGNYSLLVYAKDPHGAMDVDTLHLTILPFNAIVDFSLTYFKTGTIVSTFDELVTLDVADPNIEKYTIQANTSGKVGSVKFLLDGRMINIDNTEPFTINSWSLPVLSSGPHTLVAQSFSKKNGRGNLNNSKEATITITNSAAITSFHIVDRYGNKIKDLFDGDVININQPEFNGFNIVANTNMNTVRSVRFLLNNITARIDNRAPYAISGKGNGKDTPWNIMPDLYTLSAIPYMYYHGWGPEGIPLTVHLTIVRNTSIAADLATGRNAFSGDDPWVRDERGESLSVYPNPVSDELIISLRGINEGYFTLKIMNVRAQILYTMEGNTHTVDELHISTNQLGMSSGVYYILLITTNGHKLVDKFIKR